MSKVDQAIAEAQRQFLQNARLLLHAMENQYSGEISVTWKIQLNQGGISRQKVTVGE